ncbi:hypothetical protein Taro_033885 [Colocasia esculenta]|uniref:Uncharacterized protein n=1 Tax=Colocasia esculenta TaxID=4460 RepID=A0A843VZ63_COLES|nr:hypothetical protein [Colocasia esculenta]
MPLLFFFFFFFLCSLCYASPGNLFPIVDGRDATTLQTYIVHVSRPKNAAFTSPEHREAWHRSFLPTATLGSSEQRMVYSYDKAISGFAARLTREEVKVMEEMEGFLFAHPDEPLVPATTYTPYFLGLSRANGLWNATKKGDGVVIGIVDTGINPFHVSFDDAGMPTPPKSWRGRCDFNNKPFCNNKLIGARNFARAASVHLPFDTDGHGTHVASTVAGNFVPGANVGGYAAGTAAGVAPRAHLAVYKVNQSSELLAAIDQAIYDRVDVLSISLVSPFYRFFHQNTLAIGALAATEHGILVSCAAGNAGPFQSTVANDAPWILTVGGSTTDRALRVSVRLDNGVILHGETLDDPNDFPMASLPFIFPGAGGHGVARLCTDRWLGGADVEGKVVLCMADARVPSHVPGQIVSLAGAAAMILANPAASGNTIMVVNPSSLPTVVISHADAMEVISYLSSWEADAGVGFAPKGTVYGVQPFPAVAAFSGRGPSTVNDGVPKPDILAPGVNILGASLTGSDFIVMSGTSMATPHVSGVAALLKSLHPNWSPAALKSAMMTTSITYDSEGNEITDETGRPAGIFAAGAGHINPLRASDPGLIYDLHRDDYVRYLCGAGYGDVEVSMVARRTVDCASMMPISAVQLNYPMIALVMVRSEKTNVSRTVRNVGPAKSMYAAEVDFPVGVDVMVSPATLEFTRANRKASFTVAFAAMGPVGPGTLLQGTLRWVSSNHVVKSPVSVYVV